MHLAFLLVVLCFIVIVPETTSMNWLKFGWCVGGDMYTCSGRMLKARYREMQTANCKNCDKFFHCKGNFDAVYRCGESAEARRIAKKISDCREQAQDAGSADSRADQEANEFGRNGGECEKKYLCKASCKYNPSNRTCRPQNCHFFT